MKLAIVGITALTLGAGSGLTHLAASDLSGTREDRFAPCVRAPAFCPSPPLQASPLDRVSATVGAKLDDWEHSMSLAFERMEWEMLARAAYAEPLR